jgi:hypothetical protein
MKNFKRLIRVLAFVFFAYSPLGFASPVGLYDVLLGGQVAEIDVQHSGMVTFDGTLEELVPSGNPGNDLSVNESSIVNLDDTEEISIWIANTGGSCPTLFCNPVSSVLFSIDQLDWGVGLGVVVNDIIIQADTTAITPTFASISGAGTPGAPLSMLFNLAPADIENASNLHLQFTATHVVPVPAAVWLFGSGLLGLLGIARRKKAV